MNKGYTYYVILTDPRRTDTMSFEFDDPEEAVMFCCTALRTYDAIYELDTKIKVSRRVISNEEDNHEPIQS